ncbi:subtilisin family serine protease [Streptosporangium album]|uniref:Subtilisin family serine protease n=1 Tax=Streptosporangium album TaxID=47479 RepID=A0A7W7WDE8_9ACTN|nr:S8 family serine peptidase [Streptosporangium album]MBB4942254.1 subtilisin family serine protease [Streptosporangium album]
MKKSLYAAATALALLSALPPPAAQAEPEPAAAAVPPSVPLSGLGAGVHAVTLITGDKVRLTDTGDGRYAVDTEPVPRPGGDLPTLATLSGPDGLYVLPSDAMPAIDAGKLDRRLFNVKYLAENGYTDDVTAKVPTIVQYEGTPTAAALKSTADALPASVPTHTLESIHGAAVEVTKGESDTFWQAVRGSFTPGTAKLSGGIAKIWLDGKIKMDLAESVPMIGAPEAWAGGHDGAGVKVAVLDTGVDAGHPDLKGKIADSRSFVPDEAVQDLMGHGTHVATTIAGSGAASGGKNKGVAPGADLLIGKVLSNGGQGQDSWVIDGMEWAAAGGAKVISMSLGGGPTDGTDPTSQAVNELSEASGALFVIAAGNAGRVISVTAPGAADAALTVAAVDKSDQLAAFSSRGPRFGDMALKPDIAAPGVDITAGRAAGTSMGTPVDEYYTKANGTSMATPHVAGAAAIMAQQHPDWKGPLIKTALMSTAKDDALAAYEQGAGRVDLTRAHRQTVFATTPAADFASVTDPGAKLERKISYVNLGSEPVTLTLTGALRDVRGPAIEGSLTTESSLTVPASGTATTTVTLDPADLEFGRYTGAVVAQAGDVRVTTPVGAVREAPTHTLTVHTIGRDGKPLNPSTQYAIDVDGSLGLLGDQALVGEGTVTVRVPEGTVSVTQLASWSDGDDRNNTAWLMNPQVAVTGDTEITLDVRKASQVRFDTPKPAEPLNSRPYGYFQRTTSNGETWAGSTPAGPWDKMWVLPTDKVTKGSFRFATAWTLGQAEVAMSVTGRTSTTLHPATPQHERLGQQSFHPGFVPFTGTKDLQVADVGLGRPEDLAGKDLRGKLVLMEADLAEGALGPVCGLQVERVGPIRDAGVAGIAVFPAKGTNCTIPLGITQKPLTGEFKPVGVSNISLSNKEGMDLRERLGAGPVTVRVTGTPETPYTYVLKPYVEGRVPASMHYDLGTRDLAQVDLDVHSSQPATFQDFRYIWKQDDLFMEATSVSAWGAVAFTGPRSRPEWVGPLDPELTHLHGMTAQSLDEAPTYETRYRAEAFDRPGRTSQQWFATPSTLGAASATAKALSIPDPKAAPGTQQGTTLRCSICVEGDVLWAEIGVTNGLLEDRDFSDRFWNPGLLNPAYEVKFYRDDVELPRAPLNPALKNAPAFTIPEGPGTYRLTAKKKGEEAEWTFASRPVKGTPQPGFICIGQMIQGYAKECGPTQAVFVGYDLGRELRMDNTVAAGKSHTFTVEPYHSPSGGTMPKIAGLKLWASTDDGATWRPVEVKRKHDGTYSATTKYPALAATKGAVSLKAEAWDEAGNRLKHTVTRAFGLR